MTWPRQANHVTDDLFSSETFKVWTLNFTVTYISTSRLFKSQHWIVDRDQATQVSKQWLNLTLWNCLLYLPPSLCLVHITHANCAEPMYLTENILSCVWWMPDLPTWWNRFLDRLLNQLISPSFLKLHYRRKMRNCKRYSTLRLSMNAGNSIILHEVGQFMTLDSSVSELRESLCNTWSNPTLSAHLIKDHDHMVSALHALNQKPLKATRKSYLPDPDTLPVEVTNLQKSLDAVSLNSFRCVGVISL